MARKNVVLAALFVGETYPDWNLLVPHIAAELSAIIRVEINYLFGYNFGFKVRLLIADLGAKCHMLNMLKFNGF